MQGIKNFLLVRNSGGGGHIFLDVVLAGLLGLALHNTHVAILLTRHPQQATVHLKQVGRN